MMDVNMMPGLRLLTAEEEEEEEAFQCVTTSLL